MRQIPQRRAPILACHPSLFVHLHRDDAPCDERTRLNQAVWRVMALNNKKSPGGMLIRRRDFIKTAGGTIATAGTFSSRGGDYTSRTVTLIVQCEGGGRPAV